MAGKVDCYVYAIRAAGEIVYIGKGTGRRAKASARRCGGDAEIMRTFTKDDAARFLLTRLDERNCEQWVVSKLDLFRLREVANGCGA